MARLERDIRYIDRDFNTIRNNLYSSAINADVEPNIIVEFANIFGFEVDFQRDIRKGDTFEIYYEQFLDDDNI